VIAKGELMSAPSFPWNNRCLAVHSLATRVRLYRFGDRLYQTQMLER